MRSYSNCIARLKGCYFIYFYHSFCWLSVLYWQCLVPTDGPPATTWVVTASPTDQISRDNPRKLLVTKHIVPSPHWSTAPLTFCLKFTHSLTNNFPASKLLGRQKNDSYWAPYGWPHKAHCVLIPPSLPRQRVALRSKWCGDQDGFNCALVTEYQISLPWVLLSYSSMKFSALGIWNHRQ